MLASRAKTTPTIPTRAQQLQAHTMRRDAIEAIALFEQILPDSTRILGEDHPTLSSCNDAAGAYESADRPTAPSILYEQVLTDRIRHPGRRPPQHQLPNDLAGACTCSLVVSPRPPPPYEQPWTDCTQTSEDHL